MEEIKIGKVLLVFRNVLVAAVGPTFLVLISISVFFAMSEGLLRLIYPSWNEYGSRFFTQISQPKHGNMLIGIAGFEGYFSQNNGDFRTHLRINQAGLRNDTPIGAADNSIWIVGDSMAFGWGVDRDKIYTARLKQYSKQPTYNVAAPGGNLCSYQGLLSRMPSGIKPKAVVLGLLMENDVIKYDCRLRAKQQENAGNIANDNNFSISKGWLTNNSAVYNVITNSLKRIPFINAALVKLRVSKDSHGYIQFCEKRDIEICVSTTVNEIEYLRNMLPKDTPFVVLVAAARFEIRDDDPFYRAFRVAMLKKLRANNIDYIDTFDQFKLAGFEATHFKHDGHWVPLGHKIAGKLLSSWFKGKF